MPLNKLQLALAIKIFYVVSLEICCRLRFPIFKREFLALQPVTNPNIS